MKLDFTEFSFGYAFTENLIRSNSAVPNSAPVFPNLVQEALLGYDVSIDLPGMPLFFQFKLPELLVRNSAREISNLGLRGIRVPFLRMPLMRRDLSDQHIRLINLENSFPDAVFYASPKFTSSVAFNRSYHRADVHLNSVLFSPKDIGPLPDDRSHVVSYMPTTPIAWRCSEPSKVTPQDFSGVMDALASQLKGRETYTLGDSIAEVKQSVWSLMPRELRAAEGDIRARIEARRNRARTSLDDRTQSISTEILTIRELARVGLGVDLLIAQPGTPNKAL